jgi:hypothetical protein
LETIVPVLGIAILRSAWVELDSTVQAIMWQPLLMFLKRMYYLPFVHGLPHNSPEFPQSWTLDDNKKDDEEDSDYGPEAESDSELRHVTKTITPQKQPSQAYLEFLRFLQLGCSSPLQGYPTVVIIISTIPSSVRLFDFLNLLSLLTSSRNAGYGFFHHRRCNVFASFRILHFFLGSR